MKEIRGSEEAGGDITEAEKDIENPQVVAQSTPPRVQANFRGPC